MRPTACSLLCGLLTLTAVGQPPAPAKKESLEDDIARAVRTHPDVQVAEAEAQLANAKLHQAKFGIAQKVTAAKREKDRLKGGVGLAQQRILAAKAVFDGVQLELDNTKRLNKNGVVSVQEIQSLESKAAKAKAELMEAEQALEIAKAAQAAGEAEYDALVGNTVLTKLPVAGALFSDPRLAAGEPTKVLPYAVALPNLKPGSTADKLRTALSKPVGYECKDEQLSSVVTALKDAAGLNGMIIRTSADLGTITEGMQVRLTKLTFGRQELSLAGWLELVRDDLSIQYGSVYGSKAYKIDWYVREYGLLLSTTGRPEGALTLGEFLRAVRDEKADAAPKK